MQGTERVCVYVPMLRGEVTYLVFARGVEGVDNGSSCYPPEMEREVEREKRVGRDK